ncbi:MAG: SDR family oxidoreductase [Myxococcota bacterium]
MQLNVIGTMTLCGEAARRMAETGGGGIVNIGTLSTTAFIPKNSEYSSTKAAMIAMSKTMAREMGRHGVRVNVVTPGFDDGSPSTSSTRSLPRGAHHARGASGPAARRPSSGTSIPRTSPRCLTSLFERARNVSRRRARRDGRRSHSAGAAGRPRRCMTGES